MRGIVAFLFFALSAQSMAWGGAGLLQWEGTNLDAAQIDWLIKLGSSEPGIQARLLAKLPEWASADFVLSRTSELRTSHRSKAELRIPVQRGLVALSAHLGDGRARVTALHGLGSLQQSAGSLREAITSYQQALDALANAKLEDLELKADLLRAFAQIALALEDDGKGNDALWRARTVYQRLGSNVGLAWCSLFEAKALAARGKLSEPLEKLEDARKLVAGNETRVPALVAEIEMSKGAILVDLNRREHADQALEEASRIARATGDGRLLGRCLQLMAVLRQNRMQYAEALTLYEEARALLDASGSDRELGLCYADIGTAYRLLSEYDLAISFYDEALAHLDQPADRRLRADLLLDKARALSLLAHRNQVADPVGAKNLEREASAILDQSLSVYRDLDDGRGIAWCYAEQARLAFFRLGLVRPEEREFRDVAEFFGKISEAEGVLKDLGATSELANVLTVFGQCTLDSVGEPQFRARNSLAVSVACTVALNKLRAARSLYQETGDRQHELLTMKEIAVAYWLRGDLQPAYDIALQVLTGCEETIPFEPSPEVAVSRLAALQNLPFVVARTAHEVGKDVEAFWLCQRAKHLYLQAGLIGRSLDEQEVPSDARERLAKLQESYERTAAEMHKAAWNPEARRKHAKAVADYQAERQRALRQFRRADVAALSIPTADELAAILDNSSAIVEILPSYFETMAFVLTREARSLRVKPVVLPLMEADLELLSAKIQDVLTLRKPTDAILRSLYSSLLQPCLEDLPPTITNLIICPGPPLHDLPIAAAMLPDGRYLIEAYRVTFAPSATAWWLARNRSKSFTAEAPVLLMAVTQFGEAAAIGAVRGTGLVPLPEAAEEVREIASVVGPGAEVLIDTEATLARFRYSAPEAGVIHIATHGMAVPDAPLMSYLVLRAGGPTMSYLYAHQVSAMRLKAGLAVLSACRGYFGRQTLAGPLGLAWAFLVAGCQSVIASQWEVDSKATKEWMVTFYESYVKHGKSKAESVQIACKKLLANPEFRDPYYWAAWALLGSDR